MRGEKRAIFFTSSAVMGSPPRARGKVSIKFAVVDDIRITPACAGKRHHAKPPLRNKGSPPRARGKDGRKRNLDGRPGITPRARGKGYTISRSKRAVGITPACAGKSGERSVTSRQARDHPRVRGEKVPWVLPGNTQPGSPPRARGKAGSGWSCATSSGITPACAGKSRLTLKSPALPGDHPRVRGEKTKRIPILSHFYPDAH